MEHSDAKLKFNMGIRAYMLLTQISEELGPEVAANAAVGIRVQLNP